MEGQTKIEGFFVKREPAPAPGPVASVTFPAVVVTEKDAKTAQAAPLPEYKEDEAFANPQEKAQAEVARAQVAAAPSDMMTFFAENWAEFLKFIDENVHLLKDDRAAQAIRTGFNKPAELALITMAVKLPAHAAAIQAKDIKYVIDLALPIFDARALNFPVDVVERGFGFFLLFLAILQELAAAAK